MFGLGIAGKYIYGLCRVALFAIGYKVMDNTLKSEVNSMGTVTMWGFSKIVNGIKNFFGSLFGGQVIEEETYAEAA